MQLPTSTFPALEIATRLIISLAIGLLVGFEREWAHKDLGVRTFAITSLLGMLAELIGMPFVLGALAGVVLLAGAVNIGNVIQRRPLETTTGASLLVTFALGVLIGQGHIFTPTAAAVVMTLLLALKPQFSRFAGGLRQEEVRSAVLLGLIGFVIYPVLPNRFVDPWKLVNPRQAWLTVILVASIGFVNYVLLRVYGGKGLFYTAILGGLVNSTATATELSASIPITSPASSAAGSPPSPGQDLTMSINLLTNVAMFARNLVLLSIFSPRAGLVAATPITVMVVVALGIAMRRRHSDTPLPDIKLGSPVSISQVVVFGLIFLAIAAGASLGQRLLGESGAVIASGLGGLASSASSTVAVASLSARGQVTSFTAALATVLASAASALVNIPILYRRSGDKATLRLLAISSAAIVGAGLVTLAIIAAIP